MLFGGDSLQKLNKAFCFGSTPNLHFFPYKLSRRSSHSKRGSRRFHKGGYKNFYQFVHSREGATHDVLMNSAV